MQSGLSHEYWRGLSAASSLLILRLSSCRSFFRNPARYSSHVSGRYATGVVSSIPFVDGMSLNVALAAAKLDPRLKMFEIIRPSQVLKIGWQQLAKLGGSKLKSGDVIRMIQLATR